MKTKVLSFLFVLGTTLAIAQSFPQPSPHATVSQMVGLTNVEIDYSRPGAKGRQVFGTLLPFNEVWRTGANRPTTITFEDDVRFGDNKVPAGTYAILSIPTESAITVMLNSDLEASADKYDATKDVAAVKTEFKKAPEKVERMRFSFEDVTDNSANLVFSWDQMTFQIPITANTDAKAEINLKKKMTEMDSQFAFYNEAASYYLTADKDAKQALEWSKKSVEMAPRFWNMTTLAKAYYANGDTKNAMATADKAKLLAKEANNTAYVNMNEELIKKIKGK